ncbi:MAG: hypothetical protein WC657_01535 [Candidatus Paceibacterota bacterium]|jgi:hypothetical protein
MKGGSENKKIKPILVSRFLDIRQKPEINPDEGDFSNTFENEDRREHFFDEAKKAFEFVFDKEKFIHDIQSEPNKESFSYLKKVRRYGLVLKASYKFSDISHRCGEKLNHFLFLLGEYNDSYWISPRLEIKDEILNNLDNTDLSVNFIDTPKFKEYAEGILSQTEIILQKKELPIKEFHTLRKRLRLLSNFMQVAAAEDYGGSLHWLFYCIFKLSTELGKTHDDHVQMGLKKEIEYHKSVVEIDSDIATEFERLKPFIKKVYSLN